MQKFFFDQTLILWTILSAFSTKGFNFLILNNSFVSTSFDFANPPPPANFK